MARYSDGGADDDAVFPSRSAAVDYAHHNEARHVFVNLLAPMMTVCEAAAYLRMCAHARKLAPAQTDTPGGGMIVVPRLNIEDQWSHLRALTGRGPLPVALGKRE